MIGKRGVALCGHRGEHVTARFITCLEGCDSAGAGPASDGVPETVEAETTHKIIAMPCPSCNSDDTDYFTGLWATGEDLLACYYCGAKHRVTP